MVSLSLTYTGFGVISGLLIRKPVAAVVGVLVPFILGLAVGLYFILKWGDIYFRKDFASPWGMKMGKSPFAQFHLVVRGHCYLHTDDMKDRLQKDLSSYKNFELFAITDTDFMNIETIEKLMHSLMGYPAHTDHMSLSTVLINALEIYHEGSVMKYLSEQAYERIDQLKVAVGDAEGI